MLDKDLASSSGNGAVTFFRGRSTNSSVSLYLNIFQIITFFNLIRVAFGNNPPNPFDFINGNCFYDFSVSDTSWGQGWPAYVDVVNNLVNGSIGAITQYSDYVPATTIWDQTVCSSYFWLQSNCSLESAETFVSKFGAMFNNDTVVNTLKDCFKWNTGTKVAMGVIAGIVGLAVLFCLGMLVKAGISKGIDWCNRRGFDEIDPEDGDQRLVSR